MAKKLVCTLPNASNTISGIAFEPYGDGGMISVDAVDEATAARFSRIGGYKVIEVVGENDTKHSEDNRKTGKTASSKKDEVKANG